VLRQAQWIALCVASIRMHLREVIGSIRAVPARVLYARGISLGAIHGPNDNLTE
jgi:hypothetical protein